MYSADHRSLDLLKARRVRAVLRPAVLVLLGGCSTVGPGFKNHPGDCAIGIPWADCLPGTPGYNSGGGRVHREEAKKDSDAIMAAGKSVGEQCKNEMDTPELDPIRQKVELFRPSIDAPVPFEIAANGEWAGLYSAAKYTHGLHSYML